MFVSNVTLRGIGNEAGYLNDEPNGSYPEKVRFQLKNFKDK